MQVSLGKELESLAKKEGARLFGVGPVERFEGAPRGHHPCDFLPSAQNVIVIGIPIPPRSLNYQNLLAKSEIITGSFREEYLQRYYYQVTAYDIINSRLEQIALSLTLFLEDKNIPTLYFSPTYGQAFKDIHARVPGYFGIFSMRHAAVRAGLGEFGLNNVVVTPRYGPRVRFNTLITAAELEPTPLLPEKICLGEECQACLQECGTGALYIKEKPEPHCQGKDAGDTLTAREAAQKNIQDYQEMVWYDPVSRTQIETCKHKRLETFCRGKCLLVCPV